MVTIKKSSLIAHGALRADLPGKELLTVDNLDMDALHAEQRAAQLPSHQTTCAPCHTQGLPETVQFADFHPAKLFDFSTRGESSRPRPATAASTVARHPARPTC